MASASVSATGQRHTPFFTAHWRSAFNSFRPSRHCSIIFTKFILEPRYCRLTVHSRRLMINHHRKKTSAAAILFRSNPSHRLTMIGRWIDPPPYSRFLSGLEICRDFAKNEGMGQLLQKRDCPSCGQPMVMALPPGGKGPRTLQCLTCDRPDPMEEAKGWFKGELRPPSRT